jgi:heme/copper-type cytochrome/quinol oxidase subunit 2
MLVLGMTGAIFVVVCGLLVYALARFRRNRDDGPEPAQVYGSNQVEVACARAGALRRMGTTGATREWRGASGSS